MPVIQDLMNAEKELAASIQRFAERDKVAGDEQAVADAAQAKADQSGSLREQSRLEMLGKHSAFMNLFASVIGSAPLPTTPVTPPA